MIVNRLDFAYCEGWDPEARTAVGMLTAAEAKERDAAGEQYAVLLSTGERPVAVAEVAWRHHYCGVWFLDERRRRFSLLDFRRLAEDRMFMTRSRRWGYSSDDQPVVSWEPALRRGEDPRLLGEEEFFGFGVDGGIGCFGDAATAGAVVRLIDDDPDSVEDVFDEQWAEISVPGTDATLVVFSSGWGDGAYPVWIGRDADGQVVCFVADMLVLRGATAHE